MNRGNAPLVITGIDLIGNAGALSKSALLKTTQTDPISEPITIHSNSQSAFTIQPGQSDSIAVTFAPSGEGPVSETISIASNDPNAAVMELVAKGYGINTGAPTLPDPGALAIAVGQVTSSTVTIAWSAIEGATKVRVYIAPEPAAAAGASLPNQVLVATLPGATTSYRIEKIAAGVWVFMRVEIITENDTVAVNTAARSIGGPRANLDTPLREIHAYAPQILQLVMENKGTRYSGGSLSGNTGESWQNGPWTVTRADGSTISVTNIFRHSIPVSQPDYEIGFGSYYNNDVVDVDHRIYLVLGEPIGNRDMLRIQGPNSLNVLLPFSDLYLETPVMQVNQVGYHPKATSRWAYVSGWMGDGGSLSLANFPSEASVVAESSNPNLLRNTVVSNLNIEPRSGNDIAAGTEVRQINLSNVPDDNNAIYHVRIPNVGVSWPTAVSEQAAFKAYYTIVRGLYHNRWGGDLSPEYTEWTRPVDHPIVFTAEHMDWKNTFPQWLAKTGERTLRGGYHDAGDFDQRPMHVIVAQLMLRAFELNPDGFADRELRLPESGNTIPDLLDEALWGVAGWEHLQESDGGVRMGVESYRHPWGYYLASDDPLPYWTYSRESNHTARVAGIFAQASRLVAPYDQDRAANLRNRAIDAFNYANSHAASRTNLMYAASELFRLTGESTYKSAFEKSWNAMGIYGAFSSFATSIFYQGDFSANARTMADYFLGYVGTSGASSSIISVAKEWITKYANDALSSAISSPHAHRNGRPTTWPPDWGNAVVSGKYMDPIYARIQMGGVSAEDAQQYFNALSLSADFALGCNPDGLVYFTGMGSRRVEEILHEDGLSFIKMGKGPIPGIPVYGPVRSLPNVNYYFPGQTAFYPAFDSLPLMRRYGDLRTFVNTNEFTVWECQAPHAELFAVLQGLADRFSSGGFNKTAGAPDGTQGVKQQQDVDINNISFELKQNYPNPFNPTTTIQYQLPEAAKVKLAIYNLLGQEVRVLVDEIQNMGAHSVLWDGKNVSGQPVAAGLYFYRIKAGNHIAIKKMVLTK